MANRLIQIGRVPLIPYPYVAIKGGQVFSFSQAQTERGTELRRGFFGLLSAIQNGIRRISDLLERAIKIRYLSTMTKKTLSDIGIRRDQLPQIYGGSEFDDIVERQLTLIGIIDGCQSLG